jgi:hypothetical protein
MEIKDFSHIKWHTKLITGQLFGVSEGMWGQKTLYVLPIGRDKKFHLNDISEVDLSRSNLDELSPYELDEVNKVFGTRFGKCFERESTKKKGREINLSKETQIALAYLNGHLERIADALETMAMRRNK